MMAWSYKSGEDLASRGVLSGQNSRLLEGTGAEDLNSVTEKISVLRFVLDLPFAAEGRMESGSNIKYSLLGAGALTKHWRPTQLEAWWSSFIELK